MKMKAIKIEPLGTPKVIEIEDTLPALQNEVGGYIECITLEPDVVMIINEEGKLQGLQGNRRFRNDVIVGNIIIVGTDGKGNTCSLSPAGIEKYSKMFAEPEMISEEEIKQHSGFKFWFF